MGPVQSPKHRGGGDRGVSMTVPGVMSHICVYCVYIAVLAVRSRVGATGSMPWCSSSATRSAPHPSHANTLLVYMICRAPTVRRHRNNYKATFMRVSGILSLVHIPPLLFSHPQEFNSAVGRLLSVALPPVSGKPATPSGQSNIRPFLTSLMIKLHPQDVRAHASFL